MKVKEKTLSALGLLVLSFSSFSSNCPHGTDSPQQNAFKKDGIWYLDTGPPTASPFGPNGNVGGLGIMSTNREATRQIPILRDFSKAIIVNGKPTCYYASGIILTSQTLTRWKPVGDPWKILGKTFGPECVSGQPGDRGEDTGASETCLFQIG